MHDFEAPFKYTTFVTFFGALEFFKNLDLKLYQVWTFGKNRQPFFIRQLLCFAHKYDDRHYVSQIRVLHEASFSVGNALLLSFQSNSLATETSLIWKHKSIKERSEIKKFIFSFKFIICDNIKSEIIFCLHWSTYKNSKGVCNAQLKKQMKGMLI